MIPDISIRVGIKFNDVKQFSSDRSIDTQNFFFVLSTYVSSKYDRYGIFENLNKINIRKFQYFLDGFIVKKQNKRNYFFRLFTMFMNAY